MSLTDWCIWDSLLNLGSTKGLRQLWEVMSLDFALMVAMDSQVYVQIHQIADIKYTRFLYVSYTSVKLLKK